MMPISQILIITPRLRKTIAQLESRQTVEVLLEQHFAELIRIEK
jgi:hypothetical protein